MKTVLIITQPKDLHACAVAEALEQRDARPLLWHTSDFPTRSRETVRFEHGVRSIRLLGPDLELVDERAIDVVWHRRPSLHAINRAQIAAADLSFVESGCTVFRRGLLDGLAEEACWVNDYVSSLRAESKQRQQRHAIAVGLDTPATLFSNDPEQVRCFLRRHGGRVVYKPLTSASWKDDDVVWGTYTSAVTEADLVEDELLQAVPGLFQELVPKAFELRLTMIGQHALTAKIDSQDTEHGRLDWRRSYDELRMEPFAPPAPVIERCRRLMARLGLVFGAFDFIVTPDGRYVFLEVNQMGQFLFVERYAGLPLLDCFTEMLRVGRPDFTWSESTATIRYDALEPRAMQRLERDLERHVERVVIEPSDS